MEDPSRKKDTTAADLGPVKDSNEIEILTESEGKDSGAGISDAESNRDSLNLEDFEKVDADQIQQMDHQNYSVDSKRHMDPGDIDLLSSDAVPPTSDVRQKINPLDFDPFGSSEPRSAVADPSAKDTLASFSDQDKSFLQQFVGGDHKQDAPSQGYPPLGFSSSFGVTQKSPLVEFDPIKPPVPSDTSFGHPSIEENFLKDTFQTVSLPGIVEASPLLKEAEHPPPLKDPSPLSGELAYSLKGSAPPREPSPLPKEPTPPTKESVPSKEPTPPPRQPTPSREPTPPRGPSPPPKKPSLPPKEPTPPPKKPSPPPREPTLTREPTPPPKKRTPPREPTPPKEPTPPPREPSPPPREPILPPKKLASKEPTPPPREPTPPKEPNPIKEPIMASTFVSPVKSSFPTIGSSPPDKSVDRPVQEPTISEGKREKPKPKAGSSPTGDISSSVKRSLGVFQPLVNLIYWRDVRKSGVVFGSIMVVLLSLAYLSLISVVAYTSLTVLTATIAFRIYKNIMQAVQKSQDGHPFKEYLELDTNLQPEKVHEATDVVISQVNSSVTELKRLFLVEDLIDSVKFACLLWCLTYVGSWFNGLTLVILSVVALFTLPKVYEQNQAQIDQYVGLVRNQVNDVMTKVKAAIPIGTKEKAP